MLSAQKFECRDTRSLSLANPHESRDAWGAGSLQLCSQFLRTALAHAARFEAARAAHASWCARVETAWATETAAWRRSVALSCLPGGAPEGESPPSWLLSSFSADAPSVEVELAVMRAALATGQRACNESLTLILATRSAEQLSAALRTRMVEYQAGLVTGA